MNINNMVYGMMLAKGVSINDLAKRSGVSRQTIYKIIKGKPFKTDTLKSICNVLDLTISFEKVDKNS